MSIIYDSYNNLYRASIGDIVSYSRNRQCAMQQALDWFVKYGRGGN